MNNDTSSTPFQPGSPQNPDGAPGAPPLNIKRKDRAFFIDASGIDQPGGKEKLDEAMGIVTGKVAPPEHDASQAALQWASSVLGSEPVRKDLLAELAAKVGIREEDLEAAAERLGVTRTFVGDKELWAIPDELTSDQRMAAIGVMSERLGRAIDDLKDRRRKDRSGQPTQPASATVGGGQLAPPAPEPAPTGWDVVPAELKARRQWVVWRYEIQGGRPTKILYQAAHPAWKASHSNPKTWTTYDAAVQAFLSHSGFNGIGYVFAKDDPFFGVDVDHCLKDGEILDWAVPYVERLKSTYGEISPSGTGIKFIGRGKLPGAGGKRKGFGPDKDGALEIYDNCRFFTITGNVFTVGNAIVDLQKTAEVVFRVIKRRPGKSSRKLPAPISAPSTAASSCGGTDDEVLEVVRRSKDGTKFDALWAGQWQQHAASQSEADASLANLLVFYCGCGNEAQARRLFLESELGKRSKAQRKDYIDSTFALAMSGRTDFYTWGGPSVTFSGNGDTVRKIELPLPPANEADDDPHRLARIFLERECSLNGKRKLVYHCGELFLWEASAYRSFPDHEVNAVTGRIAKQEFDRLNRLAVQQWEADGRKDRKGNDYPAPVARKVGTRLIGDIAQAIRGEVLLPGTVESPVWLSRKPPFPASD